MATKAKLQYLSNFKKKNIKRVYLEFNRNTDADIIEYLEGVDSVQGTIKQLIRKEMKK